MGSHNIHLVEGFVATGTLPHPIRYPVFHTLVAEYMSTHLQYRVFEVAPADRAKR
jgi:hypothetical protein